MIELSLPVIIPGLIIWLIILLLPWRPWSTRETLDSSEDLSEVNSDTSDITVLIPARNEAASISSTLTALKYQGKGLRVVLVDDQSEDNTRDLAESCNLDNLSIITGSAPESGWSGKLWALEQGLQHVTSKYVLLLDADIELRPGLIPVVLRFMHNKKLKMLSLMANLRMISWWEMILMPAFIFFFKLLYPFALSNRQGIPIAAAAGGFILLERNVLTELGGFSSIKNALIDDCTLAKKIKNNGHSIWTGLSHSAISIRQYNELKTIWQMVTRTAYTQLAYSLILLFVCTCLMAIAFVLPLLGLFANDTQVQFMSCITLLIQYFCYYPTLKYYSLNPLLALLLPVIGILYLVMTWHSAINYYFGRGASWKGRHYS